MSDSAIQAQHLEALLYASGGEMRKRELGDLLGIDEAILSALTAELHEALRERGVCLVETVSTLSLRTAPEYAEFIAKMRQKSLEADIGQAGLEVLAIILYKGDATRASIDYIRGVNSSTTLRNLRMRGLVERLRNPSDSRGWLYRPTTDLLAHLGTASSETLPQFAEVREALAQFESGGEAREEREEATDKKEE